MLPLLFGAAFMSSPLKTYRVYCFDALHKIVTADWLEAEDDEAAIAKAQERGFGSKCELWEGRRLVAQLDAERKQA
jgi:hypothetical protein